MLGQWWARLVPIQIHGIPDHFNLVVIDPTRSGQTLPAEFVYCHIAANARMAGWIVVPPIPAVADVNCRHAGEVPQRLDRFQVVMAVNDIGGAK